MSVYGNHITVTPAYGRDYKKAADAVKDWQDGKDFIFHSPFSSGQYTSIRDCKLFRERGYSHVRIRFNKHRNLIDVEV